MEGLDFKMGKPQETIKESVKSCTVEVNNNALIIAKRLIEKEKYKNIPEVFRLVIGKALDLIFADNKIDYMAMPLFGYDFSDTVHVTVNFKISENDFTRLERLSEKSGLSKKRLLSSILYEGILKLNKEEGS